MAGIGEWTASDLSAPECIFTARPNDVLYEGGAAPTGAPVLSRAAVRLSLELAATAYSFEPDPWAQAGWEDFSFQVDNTLISGEKLNPVAGGLWHGVMSEWLQHLARSRVQRRNVITQVRGYRRQQSGDADTCKAIVMIHPMGEKYIVAVGFMGTGRRIYDWVSNLRVKPVDGLHQGFLQLTCEFLDNVGRIEFPKTARALSMEKLTLKDILNEMKRPDSRFVLWSSGHSQGGAVLQVFFDVLMREGVLPQHLSGIGFASPSVVDAGRASSFSGYPISHIINADDATPRVGALIHLGTCYTYTPNDDIRAMFYRTAWEDACFKETMGYIAQLRDTPGALLFAYAVMERLALQPQEELRPIITGVTGRMLPEKMIDMMDQKLDSGLRFMARRMETAYKDASGKDAMPDMQLKYYTTAISGLIERFGTIEFVKALSHALVLPHKLVAIDDGKTSLAPYLFIARRGFEQLKYQPQVSGVTPIWTQPRRTQAPKKRRVTPTRFNTLSAKRAARN